MTKMTEEERSKLLDKTNDFAEEISNNISYLAGTACLLRVDLDDSDKITNVHRMTAGTIQSMLERIEKDAEALTACMATLRHDQMKRNTVLVPMSEYEAVNRDIDRHRQKYGYPKR